MRTVIVTRHAGTVEWLRRRGIVGEVIAHASPDDMRNAEVIGMVPYHLAAEAIRVRIVDLPGLRPEQRGQDLTPEEMDAAGATLRTYIVYEYRDTSVLEEGTP